MFFLTILLGCRKSIRPVKSDALTISESYTPKPLSEIFRVMWALLGSLQTSGLVKQKQEVVKVVVVVMVEVAESFPARSKAFSVVTLFPHLSRTPFAVSIIHYSCLLIHFFVFFSRRPSAPLPISLGAISNRWWCMRLVLPRYHRCRLASGKGIVSFGVCVCVRRAATARRISLGGEGNALYPVLSSFCF